MSIAETFVSAWNLARNWRHFHSLISYKELARTANIIGCLHDPANVQQTSSKCIQNTRANFGRLLDRVNTLLVVTW